MSARIYVEGGGDSKDLHARCREGFRKLIERAGFSGRMPRLVACGGRETAYDQFCTAQRHGGAAFVALLIDSETPLADVEATWEHLRRRDGWERPNRAEDEQVLFMTTCMETWILADRATLRSHYGDRLQENSLPPVLDLESRLSEFVQDALEIATRACANRYQKGKRSFSVLARLDPAALARFLPSFQRCIRILRTKL